ncbi:hypothetical protein [Nitratiruptor sp. YY09-18]|nr:hypothetical protein [Nitratiruptor sp. YY09-18]BCD68264.1 hypothetical protein NitYY0918_C1175 [Nitratiruptor sp. YY09-18]
MKHIALVFKDGKYTGKEPFTMIVASPKINYTATCIKQVKKK